MAMAMAISANDLITIVQCENMPLFITVEIILFIGPICSFSCNNDPICHYKAFASFFSIIGLTKSPIKVSLLSSHCLGHLPFWRVLLLCNRLFLRHYIFRTFNDTKDGDGAILPPSPPLDLIFFVLLSSFSHLSLSHVFSSVSFYSS